jgi:uncharacterized protein (DUF924 family)
MPLPDAQSVLDFWFAASMPSQWFSASAALDQQITERFEPLWREAARGELDHWQSSAEGALALIILLDQFPLNMFRNQALAYSTEQQAVAAARSAIARGFDRQIPRNRVGFLYMPLMHSEQLPDQQLSLQLFTDAGLEENAGFARHHLEVVRRFGRFPHRNEALARSSTPAEMQYLNSKDAFKG